MAVGVSHVLGKLQAKPDTFGVIRALPERRKHDEQGKTSRHCGNNDGSNTTS